MICAITGAPSSGKTTLISALKHLGFNTVEESARRIIANNIKNNIYYNEASIKLQTSILELQITNEKHLRKSAETITFLDRAIPDSIAYFFLIGLDITYAIKKITTVRYDKVFFLQQLPIADDGVRENDIKKIYILGKLLYNSYISLGYDPIIIPNYSTENFQYNTAKRLNLILNEIF